jgi:hypothetical protein
MIKPILLFLAAILGFLSGCWEERRVDVSEWKQFKPYVGMQYEVIGPVDAYGIRPHSKAEVEYITLFPLPGFQGTQVGFRTRLPVGTKITVLRVIKTNRFGPPMSYEVKLEGAQFPPVTRIKLDLMNGNEGKDEMQLNPKLYRRLDAEN